VCKFCGVSWFCGLDPLSQRSGPKPINKATVAEYIADEPSRGGRLKFTITMGSIVAYYALGATWGMFSKVQDG